MNRASELGVGRSGQREAESAPCSSPVGCFLCTRVAERISSWPPEVAGTTLAFWGARKTSTVPGSSGRRRGAQPLRTCRADPRTRLGDPIQGARSSGNPHLLTRRWRGSRSALPEIFILTVAKALRNTAHCWQLPGGPAERRGQRREKKRERLAICPSGCCKTSAPTSPERAPHSPLGRRSMCC